jgi:hypothetical protein
MVAMPAEMKRIVPLLSFSWAKAARARVERADQVDLHHGPEAVGLMSSARHRKLPAAPHHTDRAQRALRLIDGRLQRRHLPHVGDPGEHLGAQRLQLPGGSVEPFPRAPADRNIGADHGEILCDPQVDTAAAPRHEHGLAGEQVLGEVPGDFHGVLSTGVRLRVSTPCSPSSRKPSRRRGYPGLGQRIEPSRSG